MGLNLKIGVDLDGVLVDLASDYITYLNEELGQNLELNDLKDYHIENNYGVTKKEAVSLASNYFHCEDAFGPHLKPIENSIECFNKLCQFADVYIVTSPHAQQHPPDTYKYTCEGNKRKWVKKYLPNFPQSKIVFIKQKWLLSGLDVLVDDKVENLEAFDADCGLAYCIKQPWNSHYKRPRLDWESVLFALENLNKGVVTW